MEFFLLKNFLRIAGHHNQQIHLDFLLKFTYDHFRKSYRCLKDEGMAEDFASSRVYFQGVMDIGTDAFLMPRFSVLALGILVVGFLIHFSPESWQRWLEGVFAGRLDSDAPAPLRTLAAGPMSNSWAPVFWAVALAGVAGMCLTLGTGEQLSFIYYSF